jgi:hypothetical protein
LVNETLNQVVCLLSEFHLQGIAFEVYHTEAHNGGTI